MTRLYAAAHRGLSFSTFDAETLPDTFLSSVQRAKTPAIAVLTSQQRQLDAAQIQLV
jgi:hypothetical protein